MFTKIFIALILLFVIAVIDIAFYKIPDLLLFLILVECFIFDLIKNSESIIYQTSAAIILFVIFLCIYKVAGGIGFGDVKLMGVIGYTLGFFDSVFVCLGACVLGIIFFILSKAFMHKKLKRLPFAPFVFVSTLVEVIIRRLMI